MKIKLLDGGEAPTKAHDEDTGFDLKARTSVLLKKNGGRELVPCGFKIDGKAGEGFDIQIRSRSGLALRDGVFVLNAPGTVDIGYRGEISVILCNLSKSDYTVNVGDKVAQMVIGKYVEDCNLEVVGSISDSARMDNGFGSSGK